MCVVITLPSLCVGTGGYQCVYVVITLPSLCLGAGEYQCVCCYHFAISMCRRWRVPVCVLLSLCHLYV